MKSKYKFIRVYKDDAEILKKRLERINKEDLKKLGIRNGSVDQIKLTGFLFRNPIFISDTELKRMVSKRRGVRLC